MAGTFKGVAPTEGARSRDKKETLADRAKNLDSADSKLTIENISTDVFINSDGKIDEVALEDAVLDAVKTETSWGNLDDKLTGPVEKTLQDLARDTEFASLNKEILNALQEIQSSREIKMAEASAKEQQESTAQAQTEVKIANVQATIESMDAAANAEDEAYDAKMAEFQSLSTKMEGRKVELAKLSEKMGFFAKLVSTKLRLLKRDIASMEKETDTMSQDLADTVPTSAAKSKVISSAGQRDRAAAKGKEINDAQKGSRVA
jgi:hypothetical protein